MKIGIVGAGHIGQAVARVAVAAGVEVMIANSRGPQSLAEMAQALRCCAGTVAEAAAFGEAVLLAIPFAAVQRLDAAAFAGRIVLDANNYYPARDGRFAALDAHEATTSGMVQRWLPGARVVKCFNAILFDDIESDAQAKGSPTRRALPIAGDDEAAKRVAARLLDAVGFTPVDAGSLDESWRFERAMPAYCISMDATQLRAALDSARRGVELPHGSWRRKPAPKT